MNFEWNFLTTMSKASHLVSSWVNRFFFYKNFFIFKIVHVLSVIFIACSSFLLLEFNTLIIDVASLGFVSKASFRIFISVFHFSISSCYSKTILTKGHISEIELAILNQMSSFAWVKVFAMNVWYSNCLTFFSSLCVLCISWTYCVSFFSCLLPKLDTFEATCHIATFVFATPVTTLHSLLLGKFHYL